MQLRKYAVVCAITLAIVFFVTGSLSDLVTTNTPVTNTQSISDQKTINPDSQTSININVTKPGSWLFVTLESNGNISLFINNGAGTKNLKTNETNQQDYFKANKTYLQDSFLLLYAGEWNITLSNQTPNPVSCNYLLALSTITNQAHKPLAWVLSPTFTAGEISIILILPLAFIDRIKAKWTRKATEALLISVIALTIVGFAPLLTIFTGTTVQSFIPTTSSMEPVIWPGDLVVIQSTNPTSLNIGDVIVFDKIIQNTTTLQVINLYTPYVHRVYNITTINNTEFFTTKGDRGNSPDPWLVPENGVNGQTILVIPRIGSLILFLSQLYAKILIISIIIAILVITMIIQNKKEGKKNENKTKNK